MCAFSHEGVPFRRDLRRTPPSVHSEYSAYRETIFAITNNYMPVTLPYSLPPHTYASPRARKSKTKLDVFSGDYARRFHRATEGFLNYWAYMRLNALLRDAGH